MKRFSKDPSRFSLVREMRSLGVPEEKRREYIENVYNCLGRIFNTPKFFYEELKRATEHNLKGKELATFLELNFGPPKPPFYGDFDFLYRD